jgi:hypothetical protein
MFCGTVDSARLFNAKFKREPVNTVATYVAAFAHSRLTKTRSSAAIRSRRIGRDYYMRNWHSDMPNIKVRWDNRFAR